MKLVRAAVSLGWQLVVEYLLNYQEVQDDLVAGVSQPLPCTSD
jgi:hypothetical protein